MKRLQHDSWIRKELFECFFRDEVLRFLHADGAHNFVPLFFCPFSVNCFETLPHVRTLYS